MALGGDPDQLAGDVADALLDPCSPRLPSDPAQAVELHPGILGAEARQHLDILDRHKQFVVVGVEHAHAVMRRAGDIDCLQCLVAADAVIGMNDEIAGRQGRRLGDELVEIASPPRGARQPVAENILLAEHDERLGREPLFERQDREPDRRRGQRRQRIAIGDAAQIGDAALVQHGGEPVGRALAKGGDRGLAAGFALGVEIVAHRLEQHDVGVGALGCEIARRPRAGVELVDRSVGGGKRRDLHDRPGRQRTLPFALVEIEPVGA